MVFIDRFIYMQTVFKGVKISGLYEEVVAAAGVDCLYRVGLMENYCNYQQLNYAVKLPTKTCFLVTTHYLVNFVIRFCSLPSCFIQNC